MVSIRLVLPQCANELIVLQLIFDHKTASLIKAQPKTFG